MARATFPWCSCYPTLPIDDSTYLKRDFPARSVDSAPMKYFMEHRGLLGNEALPGWEGDVAGSARTVMCSSSSRGVFALFSHFSVAEATRWYYPLATVAYMALTHPETRNR